MVDNIETESQEFVVVENDVQVIRIRGREIFPTLKKGKEI